MAQVLNQLFDFLSPFSSAFLPVIVALLLPTLLACFKTVHSRALSLFILIVLFFALYRILTISEGIEKWLSALESPIFASLSFVVLPALYLPRGEFYRVFLAIPVICILVVPFAIADSYSAIPSDKSGFFWFLIRPAYMIAALVSLLVLIQPALDLKWYRRVVRLTLFLVLIYGGFALRSDYNDYTEMVKRRGQGETTQILMETTPVMKDDRALVYLPSAPCRFSADGGYVQGCNVEMFQRVMMLDFSKIFAGEPGEIYAASVLFAAFMILLVLLFITARWTCGWLCPLSTAGDALDWIRKKLRLPHYKPSKPVKISLFASGLGLLGVTLLMARLIPSLNEQGEIAGCKLPIYPFCKICPGQQICPVAAQGLAGYPPLPTAEWLFGFFKVFCVLLLAFFLLAFMTGRKLWCRFCPMGLISGFFNRGGMFKLKKNALKCNSCGACAEVCPMDIDLVRVEMKNENVSSYDCVLCLKCVEKCPRDGCLSLEHNGFKITESKFRTK